LVISPYPYLMFYETGDGEIIVHSVSHAARGPASVPGAKR